jgi:hypothetical protein
MIILIALFLLFLLPSTIIINGSLKFDEICYKSFGCDDKHCTILNLSSILISYDCDTFTCKLETFK